MARKKEEISVEENLDESTDESEEEVEEEFDDFDSEENSLEDSLEKEVSIGSIGLATSNFSKSRNKNNLEGSVRGEKRWEEVSSERPENTYEPGRGEKREDDVYVASGDSSSGGDFYNSVSGAYSSGEDVYDSHSAQGLRDISEDRGERKFWGETRLPGMARVDKNRLDRMDPVSFDESGKKQDRKYK